jgi:hypothetical protein
MPRVRLDAPERLRSIKLLLKPESCSRKKSPAPVPASRAETERRARFSYDDLLELFNCVNQLPDKLIDPGTCGKRCNPIAASLLWFDRHPLFQPGLRIALPKKSFLVT